MSIMSSGAYVLRTNHVLMTPRAGPVIAAENPCVSLGHRQGGNYRGRSRK